MPREEEISRLGAGEIARLVGGGDLSAEETVRAFLSRIRRLDPRFRAFLSVQEGPSLEAAAALDRRIASGGRAGRLAGVPVAVKDILHVRGVETTCGSRMLRGYRAPFDAEAVARLKSEDAIIVGKTNLDEFAMGSTTESSAFFPTRNPWDPGRVPGGSSGGSAAAVAARMAPLALGSDTGGSVRQPAAFCGAVGVKPGYGAVSRWGLVAYASSLDQVGPLSRTVADAALALSVLCGADPKDSTCSPEPLRDFAALSRGDIRGLRIGLPREYFAEGLDPEVRRLVEGAAAAFRELGASLVDLSLPHTRYAVSAYYILAPAEASANLARFDGVRYGFRADGEAPMAEIYARSRGGGFGPEVKRRILLGTYALSAGYYEAFYRTAQKVRAVIRREFEEAFTRADLLLTPAAPEPPFPLGSMTDPLKMYLSDAFSLPCNMAGLAGMSLPCGLTRDGLPAGLQLMARAGAEGLMLKAAARFEEIRPFPQWTEPA
jgi:aspartyl-tRNA(Asn)/glutamyl-tRNA(Gln) amidotransferase subunit A